MPIVFAPLKILDEVAGDVYASAKKALTFTKDVFIRNLEIGFSTYISSKYDRYSKVHTLLSPHEPINIDQIYVNPTFDYRDSFILGEHSIEFLLKQRIVVVQAIAGHGKSMFLRDVFSRLCKLNYGVIPIFIELRDVDFETSNIIDVSYNELSAQSSLFSKDSFEALIKTGKIIFLLDGFDEIKINSRKAALKKIDQLTRDFPAANVVVTSRPTDIFKGWNPATIVSIRDYELPQILELIERSPINGEIKDAFHSKVELEYIKSHKKFLSNPLLCNMMILTFMRGGDIPQQKHIFYRKAFETLFKHHDDMKFLYKRDYHSDLQEDVFVRLWRVFCYFSYMERKFSFDADLLQRFISQSAQYISISVDSKSISDDFVESLCIIVKDGDHYSFLHRSFQEYAAASFLCTERINKLSSILDRVNTNNNDDVLELAFLINQELIEQEYILPNLEILLKEMRRLRSTKKKILLFYTSISIEIDVSGKDNFYFTISNPDKLHTSYSNFSFFVRRCFRVSSDEGLSNRILSWLRRYRDISGQKNQHNFQIDFETSSSEFISTGPITELINMYFTHFVHVRKEILERQKHQNHMLKI